MKQIALFVFFLLFSLSIFSQNQTNTTSQPKKPLSCYLADASEKTSKYFVTASIVYLTGVNLVMPILSGFVLPIVLAKLLNQKAIPNTGIPAEIVPETTTAVTISAPKPIDSSTSAATVLLSGTASFFGLFANGITYTIANRVSLTGIEAKDASSATPSGLSAKDIINIATALIGAGAKIWNYVQHSLCESDK